MSTTLRGRSKPPLAHSQAAARTSHPSDSPIPDKLTVVICECGQIMRMGALLVRCGRDRRHNMRYDCPRIASAIYALTDVQRFDRQMVRAVLEAALAEQSR